MNNLHLMNKGLTDKQKAYIWYNQSIANRAVGMKKDGSVGWWNYFTGSWSYAGWERDSISKALLDEWNKEGKPEPNLTLIAYE